MKLKTIFKTRLQRRFRQKPGWSQPEDARPGMTQYSSLAVLTIGRSARVLSVNGSAAVARRFMEMGLVPGALVRVVRNAPLGDPIQICVGGCHLALRRIDAHGIRVTFKI